MSAIDQRRRNRVAAAIAVGSVLLAGAVAISIAPGAIPGTSLPRVVTPRIAEAVTPAYAAPVAAPPRPAAHVAVKTPVPKPAPAREPAAVTTRRAPAPAPASAPAADKADDHETVAPAVREQVVRLSVKSLGEAARTHTVTRASSDGEGGTRARTTATHETSSHDGSGGDGTTSSGGGK